MFFRNAFSLIAGVSICGGLAVTTPAAAKEPSVVVTGAQPDNYLTRRVSHVDLNLASAEGVKALDGRLSRAVSGVCIEAVGPGAEFDTEMSCRSDAWKGVRQQRANAVARAQQIAANGVSLIPAVAITIGVHASR